MTPKQEHFARLWADGVSVKNICLELRVCDKTLTAWRAELGLAQRAPQSNWTPERDALLARLTADGLSLEKIAAILECSTDAIKRRHRRLGIGKDRWIKKWSDAEIAELKLLLSKRNSLEAIVSHFRCAPETLARVMQENGLTATSQSGRGKNIPDNMIEAFRAMWHSDMTVAEIAQRMGMNQTTLVWKARQRGWLAKSHIVEQLAEPVKRRSDSVSFTRAAAGPLPLPAGHPIALKAIGAEYLAGHF